MEFSISNIQSEQAGFGVPSDTHNTDATLRALTCVDLFSGAGGFSLAAQNVGIKVVAAVELNKKACETYSANLVKADIPKLYNANINDLDPATLLANHFSDGSQCDLLLGGPPCQGFSVHRIKNAGVGDPRNNLIIRYFQFVRDLQPKVFLMENVPGLLWPRHKPFLDDFYQQGHEAGYVLHPPITLDARNYGLPQRRKRVFVLGVRSDIRLNVNWPPAPTHGSDGDRLKDPSLLPWVPAAGVFSTSIQLGDENNIHMNHTPELIEVFKRTPLNGGSRRDSGRVLRCHAEHDGHKDVYGRIDPLYPGPTMTTACINPSKGRFVHPTQHHGITVRHAARFQTFPDWFVFKGGLTSAGAQIGNAVPIQLGEILLRTLVEGINNSRNQNGQTTLKEYHRD